MSDENIPTLEAVIRDVLYTLSDQESQDLDGRLVLPENVHNIASAIYNEMIKSGALIERNSINVSTRFGKDALNADLKANLSVIDIISAFLKGGKARKSGR